MTTELVTVDPFPLSSQGLPYISFRTGDQIAVDKYDHGPGRDSTLTPKMTLRK
jgi:hypothetical protein